jgi:hypothetical protein
MHGVVHGVPSEPGVEKRRSSPIDRRQGDLRMHIRAVEAKAETGQHWRVQVEAGRIASHLVRREHAGLILKRSARDVAKAADSTRYARARGPAEGGPERAGALERVP